MLSTKLRKTLTARETEGLLSKNKNQVESITTLITSLKAISAERDALKEANNLLKQQARDGNPELQRAIQIAEQHVTDLTVENNSLRNQLSTVSSKLHTLEPNPAA